MHFLLLLLPAAALLASLSLAGPSPGPDPLPYTNSSMPAHDLFTLTVCHCHGTLDPAGPEPAHRASATHHGLAYHNAHLARSYAMNRTHLFAHHARVPVSDTREDVQLRTTGKLCRQFADGARLCYWRYWYEPWAKFSFNGHRRALPFPEGGEVTRRRWEAVATCRTVCVDGFGLADVDERMCSVVSYHEKDICRGQEEGSCW